MANEKLKKIIIPLAKLPASTTVPNSFVLRFRIVSEDKNRTSHWSPIYVVAKN